MYAFGFMQGRLSPKVDGKIQAFPRDDWRQEFELAEQHGWRLMEWTLDQEGFEENPVMTQSGRREIRHLMQKYNISIPSATADFTMQAPFYKASGTQRLALLNQLERFLINAAEVGIKLTVVPLVDNGSLENEEQITSLKAGLQSLQSILQQNNQMIIFESDFAPNALAKFIADFPENTIGINYDSGNSASLGFHPVDEWRAYGERIKNVHIKDRLFQGTTVPLGTGATDFANLFKQLSAFSYKGNLIFQTARADNDAQHVNVLNEYRRFIEEKIDASGVAA